MHSLNEQQLAAVSAPEGPVLVLAGAGTGKTRVIVERMVWLVEEKGYDPRYLVALTFTNKAADEMRHRFLHRLQREAADAFLGTFHSFALYQLRREAEAVGLRSDFTILDDTDQVSLMKRLVRELPGDSVRVNPRDALEWISRHKSRVEEPGEDQVVDKEGEALLELWKRYHDTLRRNSCLDFDDLLVYFVRLLEENPPIREKYARRFRHILVDEYQDTNPAQYRIVRRLCEDHGHVFAVGDEDQSIYSWRGADINNILRFQDDFPNAHIYRLERNYRSAKPILDAANALVAHNEKRLGKNLFTVRDGEPVRFYHAATSEEEAEWIAKDILERGLSPGAVAILYRTHTLGRVFEDAFRRRHIPYRIIGGIRFYARKEIKDLLAYLRLTANRADDEAFRRAIAVPPRGIGDSTLEYLEQTAVLRRCSLFDAARDVETDQGLNQRFRKALSGFVQLIEELSHRAESNPVADVVRFLVDAVEYRRYLNELSDREYKDRIGNVDEFLNACAEYDSKQGGDLRHFLQHLALTSDLDAYETGMPMVTLLTCHAAKGLEFDHVYIVGMEEGLFPYGSTWNETHDIEEERRLCYVAMTRARHTLTLTAALSRTLYGHTDEERELSRFLAEIGPQRYHDLTPRSEAKTGRTQPSRLYEQADTEAHSRFRRGARVRHRNFGTGVVLSVEGKGDKMRIRVRFNTGREATFIVGVAPIEVL